MSRHQEQDIGTDLTGISLDLSNTALIAGVKRHGYQFENHILKGAPLQSLFFLVPGPLSTTSPLPSLLPLVVDGSPSPD